MCSAKGFSGSGKRKAFVLDTTALIAKYQLLYHGGADIYTVKECVEETRDRESREALELALSIGRIRIGEPGDEAYRRVEEAAKRLGEHVALSETDKRVAALALELAERYGRVVVFTDDYSLQNTLLELGIPYKPLRTEGIREPRRYVLFCPVCGYRSPRGDEDTCPVCGARLARRPQRRRRRA